MKVLILPTKATSGKGKFQDRLALELHKQGVSVTRDINDSVDVALHVGRMRFKTNSKKNVLRVGPACIDSSKDYKAINKAKWKSVKQADGIIYQSDFSRKVYRKFVGKPDIPETIISNGASPEFYANLEPICSPYKYNFLAAQRKWIPQARLKDIVRSFQEAGIENSALWIAGETQKKYKGKGVYYVGLFEDEVLGRYYRMCDALIHMVWLDVAPNSVVEALVAGCPVISGDQGGTIELTGWGITDREYDFKPVNLNKPPRVNVIALQGVLRLAIKKEPLENTERVDISNIAREYLSFFERVLGG